MTLDIEQRLLNLKVKLTSIERNLNRLSQLNRIEQYMSQIHVKRQEKILARIREEYANS
jgi:hypothetical protein